MAQLFGLWTYAWGDFDLLLEDGGTYRISTLNPASIQIAVLTVANSALACVGGTSLPIIIDPTNVGPVNANQLFAYAGVGGEKTVCILGGGVRVIVPNGGT